MFETLSDRFDGILKRLRGKGKLSEADVDEVLKEIRVALLEADVALSVARDLVERIRVRAVGAENVAWDLGRPSGDMPVETIRSRAPDWILLTGATFTAALRERWASIPAVRAGHVFDLGADEFVQAGPRTADALRRLARILSGRESR